MKLVYRLRRNGVCKMYKGLDKGYMTVYVLFGCDISLGTELCGT